MIDFYRKAISPYRFPSCRFVPSCSLYAREAILEFGPLKGGYLAFKRLLRCHPFHAGGYDPIPMPDNALCLKERSDCHRASRHEP